MGGGPREPGPPGRAAGGCPLTPASGERGHVESRPRGAAGGRRGPPLGQGKAGGREPGTLGHGAPTGVLPHARLRHPGPAPDGTPGRGVAQRWRPCPPALAAGWTAQGGTRPAGLLERGPPWAPRRAQGQGWGWETRWRVLRTGGWTALGRLGRGPATLSAASRYATRNSGR